MIRESFPFLYSGILKLPTGDYLVHYDFSDVDNVSNRTRYAPNYSGIYYNSGEMFNITGSGLFNSGSYIEVSGLAGGIGSNQNWTIFMSFDRQTTGECVLFSSYETGLVHDNPRNRGYSIGINDNNNLTFYYYHNAETSGRLNYTLPSKNLIAATKSNNTIGLHYYNASTSGLNSTSFSINDPCVYLSGNNYFLGKAQNAPTGFIVPNYSGYIDEFIYIKKALSATNIKFLFQSFVYPNWTTGTITTPPSGTPPPDTNNYGTSGIKFLTSIDTGDFVDVLVGLTNANVNKLNKTSIYNISQNKFKLDAYYTTGKITPYLHGQVLIESGASFFGDNCSGRLTLSGDFYLEGSYFETTGYLTSDDTLIYDVITGTRFIHPNFSHINGTGESIIEGNGLVFFNGIKIISGQDQDYYATGSTGVVFPSGNSLFNGATGTIYMIPYFSNITGYTGRCAETLFLPTKFTQNTSQVWINGIRQLLNTDYKEI